MPLRDYLLFKSSDISRINHFVKGAFKARVEPWGAGGGDEALEIYGISSDSISLNYMVTGYFGRMDMDPVDDVRFYFLTEGRMNVLLDGSAIEFDARTPGCLVPARHPATTTDIVACKCFSLHVSADELVRRLALLVGRDISGPIEFERIESSNRQVVEFVRNPILYMTRELRSIAPPVRAAYLREFEAMILTRLLLHTRHDHSALLENPPAPTGSDRIRRVRDFIHANWNKPLTSADLEAVADVSGRTLYSDFRAECGMTPSRYIKRLRLEKARAMLAADGEASVLEVALQCGFFSFGHFAAAYRDMFGELPSATVRRR